MSHCPFTGTTIIQKTPWGEEVTDKDYILGNANIVLV